MVIGDKWQCAIQQPSRKLEVTFYESRIAEYPAKIRTPRMLYLVEKSTLRNQES